MNEREIAIRNVIMAIRSPIFLAARTEREGALADARRLGLTAAELVEYLDTARKGKGVARATQPHPV